MSMTLTETLSRESTAYGGFVDAVGGVATVVLAVVGLAGVAPDTMISIATIVFGAALLVQGGTMLSEYARIIFPPGATISSLEQFGGGGLSAVFLVGAGGIVLGVLALLGIRPGELTAVAIMAFGTAFVLSSNSVWHLHMLKRTALATGSPSASSGSEILAGEMAYGSAGMQALAGLAAIVLGILAVTGNNTGILTLVALLTLGGTLVLSGSTLSATVLSLMQPSSSAGAQPSSLPNHSS